MKGQQQQRNVSSNCVQPTKDNTSKNLKFGFQIKSLYFNHLCYENRLFFIDDYDGIHVPAFFEVGCQPSQGGGSENITPTGFWCPFKKFGGKILAILTVFWWL